MGTRRHVLRTITLSVVVMHAAALALIDTITPKPARQTAGGAHHRVIQTRLAQSMTPPATRPAPVISQPDAAAPVEPARTNLADASEHSPAADMAEAASAQDIATATPADHLDVPTTDDASPPEPPTADNGDTYLPRPMLTTAPQPSAPVLMPFPAQVTEPGRYATILALFIDEGGVVRRVRVDGPALPKSMEDAAKTTFLQTHFRPGEVEGQQVKSLIRIEVVFDNTPTSTREASRSL